MLRTLTKISGLENTLVASDIKKTKTDVSNKLTAILDVRIPPITPGIVLNAIHGSRENDRFNHSFDIGTVFMYK